MSCPRITKFHSFLVMKDLSAYCYYEYDEEAAARTHDPWQYLGIE